MFDVPVFVLGGKVVGMHSVGEGDVRGWVCDDGKGEKGGVER